MKSIPRFWLPKFTHELHLMEKQTKYKDSARGEDNFELFKQIKRIWFVSKISFRRKNKKFSQAQLAQNIVLSSSFESERLGEHSEVWIWWIGSSFTRQNDRLLPFYVNGSLIWRICLKTFPPMRFVSRGTIYWLIGQVHPSLFVIGK